MSDWRKVAIAEVANVTKLAGFEFTKHIRYNNTGDIIALRALNLRKGELDLTDIKRIDKEVSDSLLRSKLYKNEVLLTYTGNGYGDCVIIEENDKYHLAPNICKISPNEEKIDPYFLYSFIRSNLFYAQMTNHMVGSGQPTIPMKTIRMLEVPCPSIKAQKKIGEFLKKINLKIRLNNIINKNLEQQVQAIFLKMFPDIFSASASSSFQNLIAFSNGKKRPETIGDIPVYGGNGVLAYTNQSNAENCVIIGRVGAYCGNTFLCPEKCWTSDNAIQAKSKNEDSPLFIYYLLRNASLPSRHIGTGQPLMTQAILNAIPVNEPSTQEIRSFINICTPLHEAIFANEKQNISLTLLRDTLLPKLMSGELDVSAIDL